MKSFFGSAAILMILAFAAFAQSGKMLDEKISQAVAERLPEWTAKNPPKNFKLTEINASRIEADWFSGNMKARIWISLTKSDAEMKGDFNSFFMRQIMPHNREIKDLGDTEAHLVELANRVEIIFAKANVVVNLSLDFPDERKNNELLAYYYSRAPKDKIQTALKFAYVVANAINEPRVFSACRNDFFVQPRPKPNTPEEKLYGAALTADNETLKSLVSQKVDLKTKFAEGDTALHIAVKQGCFETVKILVSAEADVNAKNEKGATPLMLAANLTDLEMVRFLIASGADVQAKDADGRNAAFFAVDYERAQRLEKSFDFNKDRKEIIKILQSAGLNLSEKEEREQNTLLAFWLNRGRDTDFINFLLDSGIDVNATNIDGRTAVLILALSGDRDDAIRLLLSRGANVNQRDTRNKKTALGHLLDSRRLYLNDASTLQKYDATIKILKDAGAVE